MSNFPTHNCQLGNQNKTLVLIPKFFGVTLKWSHLCGPKNCCSKHRLAINLDAKTRETAGRSNNAAQER